MAMIARNEEENFRSNLPKWEHLIDGIVVVIDARTNDRTALAVTEALPDTPRWLFYYEFDGFGAARTRVFQEAWRKFPNMSHVLVADPDWEPQPPMSKADLDFDHVVFQFKIWDRNAHTTRMSEWLLLHRPGLAFTYRLHEQLQVTADSSLKMSKKLPWEVREVEVPGRASWHNTQAGHGHSQSFNRYLFDLALLERDLADLPDDPHVLYYLGASHLAALEALLGRGDHQVTPETTKWIDGGVGYLERRLADHHVSNEAVPSEETWAAMRWLAYAYQNFRQNSQKAEYWYQRCVDFDPARADCPVFLAKLYRQVGLVDRAWEVISRSLAISFEERRFSNNFYIYHCSLPLEASLTLMELLVKDDSIDSSSSQMFIFGWKLLQLSKTSCNSSSLGYLLESDEVVEAADEAYRGIISQSAKAQDGRGGSSEQLLDFDGLCVSTNGKDTGLTRMFGNWGVDLC